MVSGIRRLLSAAAPGPPMAFLLAVPLPQHHVVLAAVPQSLGLGRIRRVHLPDRFALVLVRGTDSGSSNFARPRPHPGETGRLRISGHGLARLRHALETL